MATSSVFQRKQGKSAGKWLARIRYEDEFGNQRSVERIFSTERKAERWVEKELPGADDAFGQKLVGEKMTFTDLAEICIAKLFTPAVVKDGRKRRGLRSHRSATHHARTLQKFFKRKRIRTITPQSLRDYTEWREVLGSMRPEAIKARENSGKVTPVSIATINREFATLRRMLRYAFQEGLLLKDPKLLFEAAKVFDMSGEKPRKRLLSLEEESRLLEACEGERQIAYERVRFGKQEKVNLNVTLENPRLKAIILLGVDSGMRRAEILKLRWSDIDFDNNMLHIVATHTKTQEERFAPLSARTKAELQKIREYEDGPKPFPFSDFKRAWTTAMRNAGIEGLQFRDLRRTAITRWQQLGLPLTLAGKMAGHAQLQTTMRYYSGADANIVSDFAQTLSNAHTEPVKSSSALASEMVN